MKKLIFLLVISFGSFSILAQEEIVEHHLNHNKHQCIGLFTGLTTITGSNFQLPTIGLEYVREVSPHFGFGVISEVEIGSHIIEVDDEGNMISEVQRESAFLILPSVFYNVFGDLILTAGYGVEFENNANLGLLKLGMEYRLHMRDPRWLVLPSISWDHTVHFDGLVYGVVFAYTF